ncbi:MAG: sensor histidine kinase, partial [Telluria sp.]
PALEGRIAAMEADLSELNTLVGELLGMTRLDSAQALQRERFALGPALEGCAGSLDPAGPQPVFMLAADLGNLDGDRRLLVRAVCNVLRNAQKYAQGRIELHARRMHGGAVALVVDDDGPGIPAGERERIFAPFYRLDRSRDRATGGFGLGLSITQKAIALHGGTIRVEDSPLGGARFVMTLPG